MLYYLQTPYMYLTYRQKLTVELYFRLYCIQYDLSLSSYHPFEKYCFVLEKDIKTMEIIFFVNSMYTISISLFSYAISYVKFFF